MEPTLGEPMAVEEQPASSQFELQLYDRRSEAGATPRCILCRNIARRRFPFTLNAEVGIFRASSRGCSVCSAICDGVIGLQSRFQVSWNRMEFRFNACSEIPRFYAAEVTPRDGAFELRHFQLFTELGQGRPEPVIGAARSIAKESNSSQCFDLIRHWISECDKHPECVSSSGPTTLPTRLLDLRPSDGFVRVHATHDGEAGQYIALSHCWGPNGLPDAAKTTKATLNDRMQGIRIETLPKSFRDAIVICRALGIPFLWIDSLCIIQQDAEDWDKECSRMQDVYRNSYLTISVARSLSSSEGCFSTRPSQHLSAKVGHVDHQGRSYDVLARQRIDHYQLATLDSCTPEFPLFSRAWTFQERLLSRRVVHYAATELIWECHAFFDCECAASQEILANSGGHASPKLLFSEIMSRPRRGPEFRRKWAALIRRFALTKLSFDADRLPSLSGLARALECEETGRYLAGLWEGELPWMIGWLSMGDGACRPSSKPAPPSWSWTSLENAWVSWNYSPDTSKHAKWTTAWPRGRDPAVRDDTFRIVQCTIKSADCTPLAKHDTLGRVSSGTLVISGRLVPALLRENYFCERDSVRQRFKPDAPSEPGLYVTGRTVYCLMIGAMSEEDHKYTGIVTVSSLILRLREQDGEDGWGRPTYERIGIMSQNNYVAWKETPAWWEDAPEAVVEIT